MHDDPSIERVERWLGAPLPPDYTAYLIEQGHRERGLASVLLYATASVIERNETYETRKYCPDHITIGDDGGGRAIVIPIDPAADEVSFVDHGSMDPSLFERTGLSFRAWLARGGPVPEQLRSRER